MFEPLEDTDARKYCESRNAQILAMKKVFLASPAAGTWSGDVVPFKKFAPPPAPRPPHAPSQPMRPAASGDVVAKCHQPGSRLNADELHDLRINHPKEFGPYLNRKLCERRKPQ